MNSKASDCVDTIAMYRQKKTYVKLLKQPMKTERIRFELLGRKDVTKIEYGLRKNTHQRIVAGSKNQDLKVVFDQVYVVNKNMVDYKKVLKSMILLYYEHLGL